MNCNLSKKYQVLEIHEVSQIISNKLIKMNHHE